jgi:hypothetical protein
MALSASLNYQQEVKEILLYGDIISEEETVQAAYLLLDYSEWAERSKLL